MVARWPREDLIAPEKAYGWTFRKILFDVSQTEDLESIWKKVTPETSKQMVDAIKSGDDKALGKLYMENIDKLGYLLAPNAKSVNIELVGKVGSLDSSHLMPMATSSKVL